MTGATAAAAEVVLAEAVAVVVDASKELLTIVMDSDWTMGL